VPDWPSTPSLFALAILLTKKENTTTSREMKRRTTGLLMMDSPKWISEYDVHSSGKTRISFLFFFFFFLFYSNFNNWNPFYDVLPLDKLEIKFLFFLLFFGSVGAGCYFFFAVTNKNNCLLLLPTGRPRRSRPDVSRRHEEKWMDVDDGWRLAVDFFVTFGHLGGEPETRAL
jgi:hypothetical protein